jgi:hypothetical protein
MSGIIGTSSSKSKVVGSSKDTAKVWVRYDQTNNAIKDDYNVSTINDHIAGIFTINFSSPLANEYYAVVGTSRDDRYISIDSGTAPTASAVKLQATHYNSYQYDETHNNIIIFGD